MSKEVHISGAYAILSAVLGAVIGAVATGFITYVFFPNNYISYEEYSNLKQAYNELENKYNALVAEESDDNPVPGPSSNPTPNPTPDPTSTPTPISTHNPTPTPDHTLDPIEKVSIFDLDTFQGESRWYHNWSDSELTDTYGNEYPNGRYTNHKPKNQYTPTYLLDYKYSKCEGKIAWSKDDKNLGGSCWIDFYSGDTLLYSTDPISATDRPLSFEFSVENVETLKIICRSDHAYRSITIIYEYLNLIP